MIINNVLLYLGRNRPTGRDDYGMILFEKLEKEGYNIEGLIIYKDDPINLYPEVKMKKRFFLPDELKLKRTEIIEKLKIDEVKTNINNWLNEIRKLNLDIGIVFYGNWIPSELFSIPRYGFINYHPGPLPYLRGMEPDTFAILEGWKKIWGTVHKVEEDFDKGDLIAKTGIYKISKYSTPIQVLYNLTMLGVDAILKSLDKLETKKNFTKIQSSGSYATLKKAKELSFIDFEKDNCEIIWRKLRAFCGQDIGIRLKVKINGEEFIIFDLELYKTKILTKIKPGTLMGLYMGRGKFRNQPILKVKDGFCIMLVDNECEKFFREWIIPPRKRKRRTSFKLLLKSINLKYNSIIIEIIKSYLNRLIKINI
ncbi:MAG: formyltransferase family protein [Spirochaetes bacterium]|nr:formyltransferase family protein [Spirochaetota bacterium]